MLEAEGLQTKGESAIGNSPLVRQIKKLPFPAAFGTAVVVAVLFLPALVDMGRVPFPLLSVLITGSFYYIFWSLARARFQLKWKLKGFLKDDYMNGVKGVS